MLDVRTYLLQHLRPTEADVVIDALEDYCQQRLDEQRRLLTAELRTEPLPKPVKCTLGGTPHHCSGGQHGW
jgi:hypothetical protein